MTHDPDVYREHLSNEERTLLHTFDTWLAQTIPWLVGPKMGEPDSYHDRRRHLWLAFLAGREAG